MMHMFFLLAGPALFPTELFFFVINCFFCGFLLAAAVAGLGLGLGSAGVLLVAFLGGAFLYRRIGEDLNNGEKV